MVHQYGKMFISSEVFDNGDESEGATLAKDFPFRYSTPVVKASQRPSPNLFRSASNCRVSFSADILKAWVFLLIP